jgi:hypothetical protein
MFKEGGLYKHCNCLDMMIQVVSVDEDPEVVCVLYTNGRYLYVPDSEWVRIPKENWKNWKQIELQLI